MTAVSETSIVNMALARIGHAPVDDLSENSPEAIAARAIFETCRDYVEADFPWAFSKEVVTLADTTNDREDDWGFKKIRPSCLRFRRLLPRYGRADPRKPIKYERSGQFIYTDEQYARAEISVRIEDVTLFTPAFINCLAFYLGSELCMPLGKDNNVTLRMLDGYEDAKNKAWQSDANEDLTNQDHMRADASWISAREG